MRKVVPNSRKEEEEGGRRGRGEWTARQGAERQRGKACWPEPEQRKSLVPPHPLVVMHKTPVSCQSD